MHRPHKKVVDLHRGDLRKGKNTQKKEKIPKGANAGPNIFRRWHVFASPQPLEDLNVSVIMQKKASLRMVLQAVLCFGHFLQLAQVL